MELEAGAVFAAAVEDEADAEGLDPLAGGCDVVALHDDHVAAVTVAALQVASGGGVFLEGRDDLEEAVADRHEEVAQPEALDAGVAVADLEAEDGSEVSFGGGEVGGDEADLSHA